MTEWQKIQDLDELKELFVESKNEIIDQEASQAAKMIKSSNTGKPKEEKTEEDILLEKFAYQD